jgi:hypothetical protein
MGAIYFAASAGRALARVRWAGRRLRVAACSCCGHLLQIHLPSEWFRVQGCSVWHD